jgi:nucleoside-diphosphate-sugar epimerase
MITVLGARGFLGSHVCQLLQRSGRGFVAPAPGEDLRARRHGVIIDCVGVTVDFRARPLDAVEAHVARLLPILREVHFERFVYLSSTRMYAGADHATEDAALRLSPQVPGDLYDLSKAMGEATLLSSGRDVRIARLSNVYGRGMSSATLLGYLLDGARQGKIVLNEDARSEKDYLAVDTAARLIVEIAERGKHTVYNVAAGTNVSHAALATRLAHLAGATIQRAPRGELRRFPRIDVTRIREELGHQGCDVLADLPGLLDEAEDLAS